MPFSSVGDLPESVRNNLPKHAQEIYKGAFNSAFDHYDLSSERFRGDTREETAHKVAWAAVKKLYYKDEKGDWRERTGQM